MILYIDSSAILRSLLGQTGALEEDEPYSNVVTSVLAEVECLRSVDRFRIRERLDDVRAAALREGVFRLLEGVETIEITRSLLRSASHQMPTLLSLVDAIHLTTALSWRERVDEDLTFATHDRALATAARGSGLPVIGV